MSAIRCTTNCLVYSTVLVLACLVLQAESLKFVHTVYERAVYANRSQITLFRWKYVLDGADASSVKITCGYIKTQEDGTTKISPLVRKRGHNMALTSAGRLPGSSDTRIEPYQENLQGGGIDRTVVGFKIMSPQLSSPRSYQCSALFKVGLNDVDRSVSIVKKLVVLDPPVLINCLDTLPEVEENDDLEFSCSVTGNPAPSLKCTLLSSMGTVLDVFPVGPAASIANITRHVFRKLNRDAEEIECLADGGVHTGKANVTRILKMRHTPHSPAFVGFAPPTNMSCINLKWSEIPMNETGGAILSYKIEYFKTSEGEMSKKTIVLQVAVIQPIDEFFYHEICNLDPDAEYTVQVSGTNAVGHGHITTEKTIPSAIPLKQIQEDETSVGVIVGGIIAGIVFIVIFVILAVWCSTRSKKHEKFPTSHVEDAVDYPPQVAQSLYANIEKSKSKASSRAGSTRSHPSDYPDVVNDTSESRPMVSSNSYEQSNKAFV